MTRQTPMAAPRPEANRPITISEFIARAVWDAVIAQPVFTEIEPADELLKVEAGHPDVDSALSAHIREVVARSGNYSIRVGLLETACGTVSAQYDSVTEFTSRSLIPGSGFQ